MRMYGIEMTRSYYGPSYSHTLVMDGNYGIVTGSARQMREHIALMDGSVYYTAHNESGRPSYRLVVVGSKRYERLAQAL